MGSIPRAEQRPCDSIDRSQLCVAATYCGQLFFSLLTKPLIHPETGGHVSAGEAGGKRSRGFVSERKGFCVWHLLLMRVSS